MIASINTGNAGIEVFAGGVLLVYLLPAVLVSIYADHCGFSPAAYLVLALVLYLADCAPRGCYGCVDRRHAVTARVGDQQAR